VNDVHQYPSGAAGIFVGACVKILKMVDQRARETGLALPPQGDRESGRAGFIVWFEAKAERPA
jgi:hypothetical protein